MHTGVARRDDAPWRAVSGRRPLRRKATTLGARDSFDNPARKTVTMPSPDPRSHLLAGALAIALVPAAAPAAEIVVPFWGAVSGYNVAGLGNVPFVLGEFTLETDVPAFGGGGASADYLYNGRTQVRLWNGRGFALELPLALVHVVPRDNGFARDEVILQSYLGESPNDWHLELHLFRDDGSWLAGNIAQPTDFGIAFDEAWLNAWFTDEFDRVREIWIDEVRFDTPPALPAPVPVPAMLPLLAALLVPALARRRR
ncbi:MAG: hypothetical protein RLW62_19060 [Gammaproteobacteria bacterium]